MGRKNLKQFISILLLITLVFTMEPVTSWAVDLTKPPVETLMNDKGTEVNVVAGGDEAPVNDHYQGFRVYAIDVKYLSVSKDDATLYNESQIVSRKLLEPSGIGGSGCQCVDIFFDEGPGTAGASHTVLARYSSVADGCTHEIRSYSIPFSSVFDISNVNVSLSNSGAKGQQWSIGAMNCYSSGKRQNGDNTKRFFETSFDGNPYGLSLSGFKDGYFLFYKPLRDLI